MKDQAVAGAVEERRRRGFQSLRDSSLHLSDAHRAAIPLILAIVVIGVVGANGSSEFLSTGTSRTCSSRWPSSASSRSGKRS